MSVTAIHNYVSDFLTNTKNTQYLDAWNGMQEQLEQIMNISPLTKKQQRLDELFRPNDKGESDWVPRKEFEKHFPIGKNGNGRQGGYFGDKRYIWEVDRGKNNLILSLRMNGFNENILLRHSRPIRKDIKKTISELPCVVCGSKSSITCDHKNDLYNDKRVLNTTTQTLDDFQSLCNACNLRKRQVLIRTKSTGKRVGATMIPCLKAYGIDFIEGDEIYDPKDINAMRGTYWYDPVAFHKYIKEKMK